jgi:hypothetical protein
VLLGSGETAPSSQRIYSWLMQRLAAPIRVAVLETPAGFQPNAAQVAEEIGAFIGKHLVNFRPTVSLVAARARGTLLSPDEPAVLEPLRTSNLLLMGPGSPTYAVRQLRQSLAWNWVLARHRLGTGLLLSSAATLAAGAWTLPVYEIYKAGDDLHWVQGLQLLEPFGLPLLLVSHWNNSDGGAGLDTSRCYVGQERFARLRALLPPDDACTLVGIDEKTALCLDPAGGLAHVVGVGGVTVERDGVIQHYANGATMPLEALGPWRSPAAGLGIDAAVWTMALADEAHRRAKATARPILAPPEAVLALTAQRQAARASGEWAEADRLRAAVVALGWRINDTPSGPMLEPEA